MKEGRENFLKSYFKDENKKEITDDRDETLKSVFKLTKDSSFAVDPTKFKFSKEENEYWDGIKRIFMKEYEQYEKVLYVLEYLVEIYSCTIYFSLLDVLIIDQDKNILIVSLPPCENSFEKKLGFYQYCIYWSEEHKKFLIAIFKDFDEYRTVMFRLADERTQSKNTNYKSTRYYLKYGEFKILSLPSKVLDIENNNLIYEMTELINSMNKHNITNNKEVEVININETDLFQAPANMTTLYKTTDVPQDSSYSIVDSTGIADQKKETGNRNIEDINLNEDTSQKNSSIFRDQTKSIVPKRSANNDLNQKSPFNLNPLNLLQDGLTSTPEIKNLILEGENENDHSDIDDDNKNEKYFSASERHQNSRKNSNGSKDLKTSGDLKKDEQGNHKGHSTKNENIKIYAKTDMNHQNNSSEESIKNHEQLSVSESSLDTLENESNNSITQKTSDFLNNINFARSGNNRIPRQVQNESSSDRKDQIEERTKSNSTNSGDQSTIFNDSYKYDQITIDYLSPSNKIKIIKIPQKSLLYVINYNLTILKRLECQGKLSKNDLNDVSLTTLVDLLTVGLGSKKFELKNFCSTFSNYTNMYLKKYRSKIDRICNFYNYCLTLNNDSYYPKLLANVINHYENRHTKSKSITGVNFKNENQYQYKFDESAVFKFFYLKYFVCNEDFCEMNPINYLMPEIIENGLNDKYSVNFEFYDKNSALIGGIKGNSIKNQFLKIRIHEEAEDIFEFYIEIDDRMNKIDKSLIEEVKEIADKSWKKFHTSDKLAFFNGKFKDYFKDAIEEFKNIDSKCF